MQRTVLLSAASFRFPPRDDVWPVKQLQVLVARGSIHSTPVICLKDSQGRGVRIIKVCTSAIVCTILSREVSTTLSRQLTDTTHFIGLRACLWQQTISSIFHFLHIPIHSMHHRRNCLLLPLPSFASYSTTCNPQ